MAVPVVLLEPYTDESEMRRPSLPHIRVLRVNSRLAFNTVASAERSVQQWQGIERFSLKERSGLTAFDVKNLP